MATPACPICDGPNPETPHSHPFPWVAEVHLVGGLPAMACANSNLLPVQVGGEVTDFLSPIGTPTAATSRTGGAGTCGTITGLVLGTQSGRGTQGGRW